MIRKIGKDFHRWAVGIVLHRRMVLFWTLALTGSAAPWLLGAAPITAQNHGELPECTVLHIHDGDTATVRCGAGEKQSIRFYCIDAPELKQAPWGKRSRDHLAQLMGGRWVERGGNLYPVGRASVRLRAIE